MFDGMCHVSFMPPLGLHVSCHVPSMPVTHLSLISLCDDGQGRDRSLCC